MSGTNYIGKTFYQDRRFHPLSGHPVRIVNHQSKVLNNQLGTIVGKAPGIFTWYAWQVWLTKEHITVIVNQFNIVPADSNVCKLSDLLFIRLQVLANNLAAWVQGLLKK